MAASNSNPAGQLDCMDAEYMEPEHDIGPCDYRPDLSGAADASNDTLPQPPVPHTPWYRVVDARRRRVVAEESSKKPPAPFDSRERRQGPGRPRLPRLPEGDHKVVLRIRGGISLQQEAVLPLRAAIQTALRAPLPLEVRIRVRKEQNIALVSTPDPDLAEQLCHIQTLLLGSKSYQVSAYVASPDNSCKGVITGALPIPTEDSLINETVTYPHAINIIQARPFGKNGACLYTFEGRRVPRYVYFQGVEFRCRPFRPVTQVCHCCLRTGHRHEICPYPQERRCGNCGVLNPDEQHERCLPRCLTCGSDDHPTIDLGCPARQRGLGPRVMKEGRQDPKGHNTTPPRRDTKVSTTNQQPGGIPKNTCSQGPQSTAQYKEPKISYHEKKTKQPVQPRVPPTIRTPATPLSNHPPFAPAQCGARSEVTWPALPQREPTQAPGSAARGGPTSSSSSATGGSRDPDPQLQQRQGPLDDATTVGNQHRRRCRTCTASTGLVRGSRRRSTVERCAMVLKRYRIIVTIAVIGVMTCVGTVLFALTITRDRHRAAAAAADCNSTSCQDSRTQAAARSSVREAVECRSFYDFVCSRHRHGRPLLHQQAALAFVTRVNASLSSFPVLSESFLRGSCPGHYALLGLDLHRACLGPAGPTNWEQVARLLRRLGLAGWPLAKAQPLDRSPWDLAGVLDFNLGVFPLVRLSLRRHYGSVTIQLDRTPLPLRLHQLSVPPPRDVDSYLEIVERALGVLHGGEGTIELEQAMERAQPRDAFVYGARLIRLGDLPRSRQWDWAEYVAIVRDDSTLLARANLTLLVHEPEHLALATEILGNASAAVLFNYLGYRTLTHLAPLLPADAHFLLSLAPWADAGPSPLLAGCLRLLAHLHPHCAAFLCRSEAGRDEIRASQQTWTPRPSVVETLPWRDIDVGLRRARALLETRLVLREGSDGSSSSLQECVQGGAALSPSKGGILESLLRVQSARPFWLAATPEDGLDSRHQVEPFSMRADYFAEPNLVYVPPALSAALDDRPLGDVQAAAPLVEALLRAALPGEPHELLRFPASQLRCLARRLGISQYDGHMPDQLRELLQPSVLLQLLSRGRNGSALLSVQVSKQLKLSEHQLLLVHWASTLCDSPSLQKRLRRYKLIPTRQRVDVTLANHAAFHEAWNCPAGSAMHRSKACPPLTA
ncbi:hypothetical protein HPB49_002064 [Dermacentor silvarum]|uniref:Uncharacterized protein n=1 Tax=Dermacentor silvarum TaxID=543639 RepID=A0ACB8CUJ0_DERSI|nr:hypothetical protein HPB49_002064 [Dermacentor silvarum]